MSELTKVETSKNYCSPDKTYICSFSGGKDSVATYLYLTKDLGLPNVFGIFADTGWEDESTYEYIDTLIEQGWKICKIQGSTAQLNTKNKDFGHRPLTMVELVKIKGRFPSAMARFCTTELKLKPVLYAYQQMFTGKSSKPFFNNGCELPDLRNTEAVMVTGVRAEESPKRAKMSEFHYDDFFDIYKWMPIHKWSIEEVFAIHGKYNIKVNPLYKKGSLRVGCYPCIMTNKVELNAIARHKPETFDKVYDAEKETGSTFWTAEDTPKKFRRQKSINKNGKEISLPNAYDIKDWALGVDPIHEDQLLLFANFDDTFNIDSPVCESAYGLCEVAMKEGVEL
ncbi:MAG: phosphoadenosine phosphosulfate reductase family protein [Endozoicomonas sp.]